MELSTIFPSLFFFSREKKKKKRDAPSRTKAFTFYRCALKITSFIVVVIPQFLARKFHAPTNNNSMKFMANNAYNIKSFEDPSKYSRLIDVNITPSASGYIRALHQFIGLICRAHDFKLKFLRCIDRGR